jgi:hypothetical protein
MAMPIDEGKFSIEKMISCGRKNAVKYPSTIVWKFICFA